MDDELLSRELATWGTIELLMLALGMGLAILMFYLVLRLAGHQKLLGWRLATVLRAVALIAAASFVVEAIVLLFGNEWRPGFFSILQASYTLVIALMAHVYLRRLPEPAQK